MTENVKYYYLKLKDNFFNREEIKLLEQQENGYIYSNLYLKLCLMSLKEEGRLLFRGEIPYDENMISVITGIPIDNIRVGLAILQRLGLLKKVDSGEIFMSDIQTMIGRGSTEAERIAEYRRKIKGIENNDLKLECNNVTQNVHFCTPEIRDRDISTEKEIKEEKPPPAPKGEVIKNNAGFDFSGFSLEDAEMIQKWLDYKTERREYYKPMGMKMLRTRCLEFAQRGDLIEAMKTAMSNIAQGFFPVNKFQGNKNVQQLSNTQKFAAGVQRAVQRIEREEQARDGGGYSEAYAADEVGMAEF